MTTTDTKYNVFHRTWWKEADKPGWPNDLEPEAGERHYIARGVSYSVARQICKEWCEENEPGRYSDKAEFEEA